MLKIVSLIFLIIIVVIIALGIQQIITLRRAHSTFENYYAFRGCAQLLSRTNDAGTCRTSSGQVIKIVKFQNRWFLDGDLPICWRNFCF